eukprot:7220786-Lingulodinium_polyedra.AAC.1
MESGAAAAPAAPAPTRTGPESSARTPALAGALPEPSAASQVEEPEAKQDPRLIEYMAISNYG